MQDFNERDKVKSTEEALKGFTQIGTEIRLNLEQINALASQLNKQFGETRERIGQMEGGLRDVEPFFNTFGDTANEAAKIISQLSIETRKNVIASNESLKELLTISKVIGQEPERFVGPLTDVGIQFGNIQDNLEGSVDYIRSIGMNTQEIMKDALSNSEMMNRYNFEGGVMGLTKMAAQSAMLRVNMNATSALAEKVFDPEGAIQVASAMQRLGVNMGMLSDPFALMDATINDPAGLQKSIADVAASFTIFDEKTKSFKIDPGSIRKLREIATETGISYENLTKMGLAAANSGEIMKQLSFAGNLSEEDKMYVANLAEMKGGDYVIKVGKTEEGKDDFKKLSELSEDQLKATIEASKSAPKSMEDIARAQLSAGEIAAGNLTAIRNNLVGGIADTKGIRDLPELTRGLTETVAKSLRDQLPKKDQVTGVTDDIAKKFGTNLVDVLQGKKSFEDVGKEIVAGLKDKGIQASEYMSTLPKSLMENLQKQVSEGSLANTELGKKISESLKTADPDKKIKPITNVSQIGKQVGAVKTANINQTVKHDGTINIEIKVTGTSDDAESAKTMDKLFRSSEFQQLIYNSVTKQAQTANGKTIALKMSK
jgi:phosphosulfolactate synthase (CoM biosynthesis protein A)